MKRKAPAPTLNQWRELRLLIGEGFGEGEFTEDDAYRRRLSRCIQRFEDWLEDRYSISFNYRLVARRTHK